MRRRVLIAELRATVFFVSIVAWILGFVLLIWAIYGLAIQRIGTTAQTTQVNGLYPNSIAVIENGLLATACIVLGIGGIVFLMFIREPMPEPHVQHTLENAAALLDQEQFAEARALLESIPHDYTAQEWIAHLDVVANPAPVANDKGEPAKTDQGKT
jgi:hypothetical protein